VCTTNVILPLSILLRLFILLRYLIASRRFLFVQALQLPEASLGGGGDGDGSLIAAAVVVNTDDSVSAMIASI